MSVVSFKSAAASAQSADAKTAAELHPDLDSVNKQRHHFPVSPIAGILIIIVIYFVSMILAESILHLYPILSGWRGVHASDWLTNSTLAQFLYVVLVEVLTIGGLLLFMRQLKVSFAMLGLTKPRLRDPGYTLLAYIPYFVLNAVATLGAAALFHFNTAQQQQTGFQPNHAPLELAMTFISLVILPPIVEEIAMRGFLFGSLKQGMSVIKAALLTSVIFAVAHLQFGSGAPLLWVAAIDTFVLSLVLCYLRQKTGRLWAGIGLHSLKNLLAFWAVFVAPHYRF